MSRDLLSRDLLARPRVGAYTLIRPLGEGGFARTYEARHERLGTLAAIKISRAAVDSELLLAEARLLWDLHHPSLPAVRDAVELDDGRVALVLRYVEGTPLENLAPIDAATAARLLGRLMRALRLIHHRGIIHNDVKPANVIVEPDRHGVVLIDFGVASARPGSRSRAPGLTPVFAAPEVVLGRPPRPESDLYSLGLTILWALGARIESRSLPSGVPEELLELLVALTRREPADRPCWGRDDPMRRLEQIMPLLAS
jgi:serine/threonine protein kinase